MEIIINYHAEGRQIKLKIVYGVFQAGELWSQVTNY